MSLHVGGGRAVRLKDIVAILNLATTPPDTSTWEVLELLKSDRRLVDVSGGKAKSCIITTDGGYMSAISSQTLQRRLADPGSLFGRLY